MILGSDNHTPRGADADICEGDGRCRRRRPPQFLDARHHVQAGSGKRDRKGQRAVDDSTRMIADTHCHPLHDESCIVILPPAIQRSVRRRGNPSPDIVARPRCRIRTKTAARQRQDARRDLGGVVVVASRRKGRWLSWQGGPRKATFQQIVVRIEVRSMPYTPPWIPGVGVAATKIEPFTVINLVCLVDEIGACIMHLKQAGPGTG